MSNDFNPLCNSYTELQIQYHRFKGDDSTIAASNFCRQLIANSVSSLSLKLYKQTGTGSKEIQPQKYPEQLKEIAFQPNDFQSWAEFIRSCILNQLDTGNGYGVALRNPLNNVYVIMPIENATAVNIKIENGVSVYTIPPSLNFVLPKQRFTKKNKEVIHVKGLGAKMLYGESIEYQNRTAFTLMRKAERHGMNWFDNAFSPSGVFTCPPELTGPQYLQEAKEIFEMKGSKNAGEALVLKPNFSFTPINADNRSNQFIEFKEYLKREIMTAYGVPVGMLLEGGQDFDKAQMAFFKSTVKSYCKQFQESISKICPDGYFFEFDTDEFIKGDPLQQIQFIKESIATGILTINEGRVYMGYETVEGGDVHAISTNNITLGSLVKIQEMQDAEIKAMEAKAAEPVQIVQPANEVAQEPTPETQKDQTINNDMGADDATRK